MLLGLDVGLNVFLDIVVIFVFEEENRIALVGGVLVVTNVLCLDPLQICSKPTVGNILF